MMNNFIFDFIWGEIEYHQKKIVDYCLDLERPNTVESEIAVYAKHNLWESKFNFLESSNESISALKCWITQICQYHVSSLNRRDYRFIITESWAHVTRKHGYHKPHYHSGSTWSGIIYIDTDKAKPGCNHWLVPFNLERKPGLDFFNDTYTVEPKPGLLVLFPSMLTHYAESYLGNKPRIVIAFNAICI
jgi:Putative 2OG-Fe(II) oxygenase